MPLNSGESDRPTEPKRLVEHFFRHESANLVSVLTRAFGFSRIDLIEDMVQSAMMTAMNAWRQRGIPDNPAGWIHRVARNRILDSLRREKVHLRAIALSGQSEQATVELVDQWLEESALSDSLLRMMFVCCHPSLDRTSQIALTLKILCGFSVKEIARGLLQRPEAIKKRIQRAKAALADQVVSLEFPDAAELQKRLSTVHDVLYLMFNEGYSTSNGIEPIRNDVCEEAARLCHLLCEHSNLSSPKTRALLALMLFHAARLESRVDERGAIVLLEDQDRSTWDLGLIRIANQWLAKSKDSRPSRFHYEAGIAQQHCCAKSVSETDWTTIVKYYSKLILLNDSPVYRLNQAIALGQSGEIEKGMLELESIRGCREMRDYYLLDCAFGRLHELNKNIPAAIDAYLAALSNSLAEHERQLLANRLLKLANR